MNLFVEAVLKTMQPSVALLEAAKKQTPPPPGKFHPGHILEEHFDALVEQGKLTYCSYKACRDYNSHKFPFTDHHNNCKHRGYAITDQDRHREEQQQQFINKALPLLVTQYYSE